LDYPFFFAKISFWIEIIQLFDWKINPFAIGLLASWLVSFPQSQVCVNRKLTSQQANQLKAIKSLASINTLYYF